MHPPASAIIPSSPVHGIAKRTIEPNPGIPAPCASVWPHATHGASIPTARRPRSPDHSRNRTEFLRGRVGLHTEVFESGRPQKEQRRGWAEDDQAGNRLVDALDRKRG